MQRSRNKAWHQSRKDKPDMKCDGSAAKANPDPAMRLISHQTDGKRGAAEAAPLVLVMRGKACAHLLVVALCTRMNVGENIHQHIERNAIPPFSCLTELSLILPVSLS